MRALRFCLLLSLVLELACDQSSNSAASCPKIQPERGFSLSPKGFPLTFDQLDEFFDEVALFERSSLMWNGAWREDTTNGSDAGQVPEAATTLLNNAQEHCYTPAVVFGWRSGTTLFLNVPANPTNNWTNVEAQNLFQTMLLTFVSTERPQYVFLGNENDFYYEQNRLDYLNWLDFYNLVYEAIKDISSDTLVGPIFNYEHMAGSGVLNGWVTPYWEALLEHDFDRIDIIGVTVYPFFQYTTPSSIPENYLDPLFDRIAEKKQKPIAITETGWPAENSGGFNPAWVPSEAHQTDLIPKLYSMIQNRDVHFLNWLFLYPLKDDGTQSLEWKTFGSISLRNQNGGKRAAYEHWRAR